jgi:hypothetical protein
MTDNDFSSYMPGSLISFCIHLDWHRVYAYVYGSNDAMPNAIDERATRIWREREGE